MCRHGLARHAAFLFFGPRGQGPQQFVVGSTVGVCPFGNPGMASGGTGDVLSGVLGALLAQGLAAGAAARLGVCLHARAADLAAAAGGERGLLATDLVPWLRRLLNGAAPLEGPA